MPLSAGTRLGPYQILAPIGAGGMGEVYCARDSGLDRIVAIKVSTRLTPDPNMASPIDTYDSVFIEELPWLEVRDAMRVGKTTVIIPTGGVEQNGPYLATGKHNYVLRATTEAIARKLGNALVAPIVAFVPEGDIDPPTSHKIGRASCRERV